MKADDANVVTGTPDKDYNLIWYVEACLSNAVRLQTYIQDATQAGDTELADFSVRRKPTAVKAPNSARACSGHGWRDPRC